MGTPKRKPAKQRKPKLHQPALFDDRESEEWDSSVIPAKTRTHTLATQRQTKKEVEMLKIPTLQEAIDEWDDVTGVAPECELMPLNSETQTKQLCESIRVTGQTNPIHLDSVGRLLNGRHPFNRLLCSGYRARIQDCRSGQSALSRFGGHQPANLQHSDTSLDRPEGRSLPQTVLPRADRSNWTRHSRRTTGPNGQEHRNGKQGADRFEGGRNTARCSVQRFAWRARLPRQSVAWSR